MIAKVSWLDTTELQVVLSQRCLSEIGDPITQSSLVELTTCVFDALYEAGWEAE